MLIDRFGRTIDYLRISVTDRCNLNCSYCVGDSPRRLFKRSELLTYEEILEVVDCAYNCFGIKNYRLTGGEPLVRKNLERLIAGMSSRGINVGLTTNGTLLASQAKKLYDAGLRHINISLDNLSAEKFSKKTGGDIKSVLDGVKKAHEIGFSPIKINVVVDGETAKDVPGFIRWAEEYGVVIRFIEKMPIGPAAAPGASIVDLEQNLVGDLSLTPVAVPGFGPGRYYEYGKTKIGFITSVSKPFCQRCNRLRMTSDGKLVPCLGHGFYVHVRGILRGACADKRSAIKKAFEEVASKKPKDHSNYAFAAGHSMASIGG